MALSKKGLRKIAVDGKNYVWKGGEVIAPSGDIFRFFVQSDDRKGTLLILDVIIHQKSNELGQQIGIASRIISEGIRCALKKDWKPRERLPQYQIRFPIEIT